MSQDTREKSLAQAVGELPRPLGEVGAARLRDLLLDTAIEGLRAERAILLCPAPGAEWDDEPPLVAAARGFGREPLAQPEGKVSPTLVEHVLDRGLGVVSAGDEAAALLEDAGVASQGIQSLACQPLFRRGRILGLLYVDHRFQPGAFDDDSLAYLQGLCEAAAPALGLTKREPSPEELEEALEGFLSALGRTGVAVEAPGAAAGSAVTRVMIIDDHPVVRQGLSVVIEKQPDLTVCATAASRPEALETIAAAKPDLALVDLSLGEGGGGGLQLLKDLRTRYPDLQTLVLSMHPESLYVERVLRAGARGYVAKQQATEKVLGAIRTVLAGDLYVSEESAHKLLGRMARGEPHASPLETLSDRELQVFELIGTGIGTSQIAQELHLSVKTIETYRANLKKKLGLRDGSELIQHAVRWAQEQGAG